MISRLNGACTCLIGQSRFKYVHCINRDVLFKMAYYSFILPRAPLGQHCLDNLGKVRAIYSCLILIPPFGRCVGQVSLVLRAVAVFLVPDWGNGAGSGVW